MKFLLMLLLCLAVTASVPTHAKKKLELLDIIENAKRESFMQGCLVGIMVFTRDTKVSPALLQHCMDLLQLIETEEKAKIKQQTI